MNLYHVGRIDKWSYDNYSDFVCAAENEETARNMKPSKLSTSSWTNDDSKIVVKLIGTATEGTKSGIIIASYHAG